MACLFAMLTNAVCVCLCIWVFVFVYLQVRHPGTLFLRSSNNILFKNIAHDRPISKFYTNCICVLVYLCICVFVFVYLVIQDSSQTNWNFLLPVRFLQLFCWGTLNGLKSVESIFPLSRSYFIFLRQTGVL